MGYKSKLFIIGTQVIEEPVSKTKLNICLGEPNSTLIENNNADINLKSPVSENTFISLIYYYLFLVYL